MFSFDVLRVAATIAVILLHVSAQNWHSTDIHSFEWCVFTIYDGLVRWGVPIFTMISGAIFLNRDIPIKKIYTKHILRIITAFIFWSAIYALVNLKNGPGFKETLNFLNFTH
ncbi:MAG: acyltransferase family protein [Solobacterium sp.]|nr:acyltransferase family protein [Solobacterium sp.]